MTRTERLSELVSRGFLKECDASALAKTGHALPFAIADKMVENVVGCFELPIGMGLNFLINGKDYVVPMVVEEPSVVAAVSHAAKIVREAGGFVAESDRSVMTGQIQVVGVDDLGAAMGRVIAAKADLIAAANTIEPGMKERGGGAIDLDARVLGEPGPYSQILVVHLYVDACDAMGANLINTMCEGIAGKIEALTGGRVYLRILSNLTDRRRVRARCEVPAESLAWQGFEGLAVAEGVVRASEFAETDPYRAATHNKGIMNGIDAVAIATGQDWRAIEAGAHAFAAAGQQYGPLARWRLEGANLIGEIDVPMAVGTVGGPIRLHPTVATLLGILDVKGAGELGCVLGAVGLAQNFSALKALGSTGIQKGHMALHARTVAATAGAEGDAVERVASQMIEEGNIKVERAAAILAG
ncbi:MAG: hydroxymethylglutaryl-CoA reductase [Bradymonadia bacterium]|jgi:hydroxymethylglutaryl-CoA reductase